MTPAAALHAAQPTLGAPVRLRWDGSHGEAHCGSVSVALHKAPPLGALTLDAIDYVPAWGVADVRPRHEARREMTAIEIAAAEVYLMEVCAR